MRRLLFRYDIMGNIQVVRDSSKRKPIFNSTSPSHSKSIRSPSPVFSLLKDNIPTQRFSNNNRIYKTRESDKEETYRLRDKNYYRNQESLKNNNTINSNQSSLASRNRISNLNDFLFHVKKQMNQGIGYNSGHSSQLDSTLRRQVELEMRRKDQNRELKLNVRLENQKLKLDKYKQLVERQLSKSHSIQKISLEGNDENEKLLIIQYGQYEGKDKHEEREVESKQNIFRNGNNLSFGRQIRQKQKLPEKTRLNEKISSQKEEYENAIKSAKDYLSQLQLNIENIADYIHRHQKPENQSNFMKKQLKSNRITLISNLINGLTNLQNQHIEMESKIKAAIQSDNQSQASETLTEQQMLLLQAKHSKRIMQ